MGFNSAFKGLTHSLTFQNKFKFKPPPVIAQYNPAAFHYSILEFYNNKVVFPLLFTNNLNGLNPVLLV